MGTSEMGSGSAGEEPERHPEECSPESSRPVPERRSGRRGSWVPLGVTVLGVVVDHWMPQWGGVAGFLAELAVQALRARWGRDRPGRG
ncbi:hypothetical protein ACLF6K_38135 (plasmid) [Streptomyces xanthophaeus]|uniref:hypothetical protein n=1 Tax=Streptomyces xanthophaeus TaxID=67385 RepID=UPI00398FB387